MKHFFFKISFILVILSCFAFNKVSSQSNQYLNFDGTDDYVNVPNASALLVGSTTMSMTGWFFDNNLNYGQGMMGFRTGTECFYMITLANGVVEARFINSSNVTSQPTVPANTIIPNVWQHFAFVYDGTHTYFYLNGNLVSSATASGTLALGTTPFAIGRSIFSNLNFYYNGNIDEVSVWNKALTQAEIQGIKNNEINMASSPVGLLMYYKFNQGVPGGNNTGISTLHNEVAANTPLYDGVLTNLALTGTTSNFEGTLNTTFQAISFSQLPTKLTTAAPFKLNATASSGLPVGYTVLSGPATLHNDTVVLTGTAGTVKIKAYQNGNAQYDTATPITNVFDVVDPNLNVPTIDPRHPIAGNVYMPSLAKIQLAALATINYPTLFSIQDLKFKIGSTTITAHDFGNGHYTAWWQPPTYGSYTIQILSTNNFGAVGSVNVNINVVPANSDTTVQAFSGVLINTGIPTVTVDGNLPSFIGAYDTIIATLTVSCPSGGCGAWDHTASIEARSHEGNWFEIIRYITPYATACSHSINLADYESLLKGKVTFRVTCGTFDNGYLYALNFTFKHGPTAHMYSQVTKVWDGSYLFGDYVTQQPVSVYNYTYPASVLSSKLKLISTGHMGPNNTSNAAEFYEATHHIYVNNTNTFAQHNWVTCNPNPDNCMPQSGTWQYNRAGWCPGSIAKPYDYDMTTFIPTNNIALKYVFYENYTDQCNSHYPPCVSVSGSCDCTDGANPFLVVACNLINFYDAPPANPLMQNVKELRKDFGIAVYPNPSNGMFNLTSNNKPNSMCNVVVYNLMGNIVSQFEWNGDNTTINLTNFATGVYIMKVSNKDGVEIKKLMVR